MAGRDDAGTPDPKFIDLLNFGRACNQTCRLCYAEEERTEIRARKSLCVDEDMDLARRVISANPGSEIFIYPKEVTTTPEILDLSQELGQDHVLTNGKEFHRDGLIGKILESGIRTVKFSLFSDAAEQRLWKGNSEEEYRQILKNIKLCSEAGLDTQVFTTITSQNIQKLPIVRGIASSLGVSKVNLLRLMPIGAGKGIDDDLLVSADDLKRLMEVTEGLKDSDFPRISYGMHFGPDFHARSAWSYLHGDSPGSIFTSGDERKYLCPVTNNSYAGASMRSKNVYWCFFLMSDDDAKIGALSDDGQLRIDSAPDFSENTLYDRLDGICSKENCVYSRLCLGGCRSAAYIMAKRNGHPHPEYAGMDICRTAIRSG
ncbi:radical SAM protein [Candidatus Woesearchaeota archaeon]|nr:radical SAM protein [Candidatus Woesearchaeota archaeon]